MPSLSTFLRVTWVTARRELLTYFLSPLSYLLAALFLVVQGYSFWLLCQTLGATRGTTTAVLAYFFGGTFLYWLFLLFLVALLTMRLFAEERQRGSLELLLSAAVPEGALLLGKFLGVFGCYVVLWLPTVAYMGLLGLYLGPQVALDSGAVLGGYLGTLLVGSSALAIGVLASTLAPTPLVAASFTFASLSLLLLGGLVAELYIDSPRLAALFAYGNLFQHLDEMARGSVDSRHVVYHLSLLTFALVVAARLLKTRSGDRRGVLRTIVTVAVGGLLLVGVNLFVAQHPRRADLTQTREHALSPAFVELLRGLGRDGKQVAITALHAEPGGRDELFLRLRETLRRAEQVSADQLRLTFVDVDRHHDRARLLAEQHHIERDDLAQSALIVESNGRSKLIARRELADLAPVEPGSPPRIDAYRGEEAIGTAIVTVLHGRTPTICFSRGHGEAEHDSLTGSGLSELSTALIRDNLRPRALLAPRIDAELGGCDVLVIAGLERPFLALESAAIGRYLDSGGRLLLLAGALIDRGLQNFLDTGLESLLSQRGVRLAQAVAIDPAQRLGESLAFIVENSYGAHPITAALSGRRTLWPLARPVFPLAPLESPAGSVGTGHSGLDWRAQILASTSDKGFGETDLPTLRDGSLAFDAAHDVAGPLPLAVAAQPIDQTKTARIVVIGSTQLAWNDSLVLFNRDLLLASVKWLADVPLTLTIAPRRPSEIRLALTAEQERRLFVTLVVGLPLLVLLLGIGVRRMRRGG